MLVTAIKTSRRAGCADDRVMDEMGMPGGPDTGTPKVRYQTRPFYPRVICLHGGERSVDGDLILGGQTATGTQVEPNRRKTGKG